MVSGACEGGELTNGLFRVVRCGGAQPGADERGAQLLALLRPAAGSVDGSMSARRSIGCRIVTVCEIGRTSPAPHALPILDSALIVISASWIEHGILQKGNI